MEVKGHTVIDCPNTDLASSAGLLSLIRELGLFGFGVLVCMILFGIYVWKHGGTLGSYLQARGSKLEETVLQLKADLQAEKTRVTMLEQRRDEERDECDQRLERSNAECEERRAKDRAEMDERHQRDRLETRDRIDALTATINTIRAEALRNAPSGY